MHSLLTFLKYIKSEYHWMTIHFGEDIHFRHLSVLERKVKGAVTAFSSVCGTAGAGVKLCLPVLIWPEKHDTPVTLNTTKCGKSSQQKPVMPAVNRSVLPKVKLMVDYTKHVCSWGYFSEVGWMFICTLTFLGFSLIWIMSVILKSKTRVEQ